MALAPASSRVDEARRVPDIRLAVLGCGAATERFYLPALSRMTDVRVTLLIDPNAKRRDFLASHFDIQCSHNVVDDCYDLFDAAIVALPNSLHAVTSVKLLLRQKAVLVEKPMAISVAECKAMIDAAEQAGALLAVSQKRRFLPSHRLVRFLLLSTAFGRIEGFDFREGSTYNWAIAADPSFCKETAGGGVLMDTGVDTLDCLLHWLGDFAAVEYFDDAEGGVEANCLLKLRLQNGVCGVVELSRTRRLRNTAIIRCERAIIEVGLDSHNASYLKLVFADQPYAISGRVEKLKEPDESQGYSELVRLQAEDFILAIRDGRKPEVDGQSSKCTIQLIETCYLHRRPLELPWMRQEPTVNR